MSRCLAEFCANWTGDGCVCQVLGLTPIQADGAICRDCLAEGFQLDSNLRCDGCAAFARGDPAARESGA